MNAMKFVSAMVLAAVCGTATGQDSWPPLCCDGDGCTIDLRHRSKLSVRLANTAVVDEAGGDLSTLASAFMVIEFKPECCLDGLCSLTDAQDDSDYDSWTYPAAQGGSAWISAGAGVPSEYAPSAGCFILARSGMAVPGVWVDVIDIEGDYTVRRASRCVCAGTWDAYTRGSATVRYTHKLGPTSTGITIYKIQQKTGPEWTSMMFTSVNRLYAFMSFNAGLGRSAEIHGSSIISARGEVDARGLTTDPITGEFVSDIEIEREDLEMEIVSGQLAFDDKAMDANGDGRFNFLDAAAIRAEISSTDPAWMGFDFNENGIIDEFDADLMDVLIADNIDSGVLGDIDSDGLVDCTTDLPLLYPFPTATFGDVDYLIQLDANVDGLLNADDLNVLQRTVFTADFDHSGFVDTDDLDAFTAAFTIGDESADVDLSGFVDTDDHSAFMSAFTNGC